MTGPTRKDEVAGADRLARRLRWLRRSADVGAADAVAAAADDVRLDAQDALRKLPGGLPRLADHAAVEGEGARRAVVIRHPAAPFVEHGASRLPPRPFLQPAADRARGSFRKRITDMLARLLGSRP